ncbi:Undecaprenyl-phosphate 4-deoxy-4-formamido-L-arabinose transferase [Gemmata obscuriglobus]|uniref:Glycosyltransferase family 2 protein n=1 Tax=Gemmata obscuriglobus TaxID=114 RepID=A0A2Z3GWT6_9BACT|nr:glycosyltransferase family 2 protein [Gemmata obscuriglobus]AWM38899.1 glycosyltransferase family 2 protein [Gemmata obscuriglobus]QEG28099.1 Undecaprenyl-phosphate 4-deoxy-4-formamido-L-arabinose transferase [Gemmata obscuriglobus]VTS05731.1 dolichol-phosphate mannosyltransferase : Membrane protein containing Glycosyl transferase, family 2 domain protein OS=Rhodopirellula sp. SWK7 GN=RRSWK_06213 PE=4 SV=1: Glycos_transf_2 [Gemmata obscuriglobus UQM 2246]
MGTFTRTGLSLVIPAFNEAAVISRAIAEAEAALGRSFERFEILVVDDGSSDATATEASRALEAAPHTRLLRHPTNRGYGAALRTGFEAARFDLVAFTDADCQFDLTDLAQLAEHAGSVPVVVGFRADRQDPWRRRFLSWGYNVLARALLGTRVRDVDCALKVFRRDTLAGLMPESRGFFVNTEMLTRARQLGLEVTELPVTHRPRAGGESKVSLREVPRTARTLLNFWWHEVVRGDRRTTPAVVQARLPVPRAAGLPGRAPAPSSPPALRAGLPERHRAGA